MGKLFRGIKSIIVFIEVVGALLSAIFFIFEKIGDMKRMHKPQTPPSSTQLEKK